MNRIAVFGKPGGGKSTLSRQLSAVTGIELYPLDLIKYKQNGDQIPHEEYSQKHADLLSFDSWLIEGLGTIKSFWERIDAADTLNLY
jgi:adenylate kinase family enzyme